MHVAGKCCAVVLIGALGLACGGDFEPNSGFNHPCETPMAGVMGCPATSTPSSKTPSVFDACQRLVSCGVLSASYERGSGSGCNPKECSGECKPNKKGQNQCFVHWLVYHWCVAELSTATEHICGVQITLSPNALADVLRCITNTQCGALGLTFAHKRNGQQNREVDEYTCPNGSDKGRTATVCDQGLLRY